MGNLWDDDDCASTDYIEERIKNEIMHPSTIHSTISINLSQKLNIKL